MPFMPVIKATGIELNEPILLHLDKESRRAVGITFLNYSILIQKADFGPRSFPLTGLAQLSDETREIVMDIVATAPVKGILSLSTYTPSLSEGHSHYITSPAAASMIIKVMQISYRPSNGWKQR
jgi:hypothetical protein